MGWPTCIRVVLPGEALHGFIIIIISHAVELTLFLWHMLAGTTETVAEHSTRLQPSINLHAPVTAFCSAALE